MDVVVTTVKLLVCYTNFCVGDCRRGLTTERRCTRLSRVTKIGGERNTKLLTSNGGASRSDDAGGDRGGHEGGREESSRSGGGGYASRVERSFKVS